MSDKLSDATLSVVGGKQKPVVSFDEAQDTAEFLGLGPRGTDPENLTSFKNHLIYMFDNDDDLVCTDTLVSMANGLFCKGPYREETIHAFKYAVVKRLTAEHVIDDSDPLLNALYLAAGEFLGLMHEVERERYLDYRVANTAMPSR